MRNPNEEAIRIMHTASTLAMIYNYTVFLSNVLLSECYIHFNWFINQQITSFLGSEWPMISLQKLQLSAVTIYVVSANDVLDPYFLENDHENPITRCDVVKNNTILEGSEKIPSARNQPLYMQWFQHDEPLSHQEGFISFASWKFWEPCDSHGTDCPNFSHPSDFILPDSFIWEATWCYVKGSHFLREPPSNYWWIMWKHYNTRSDTTSLRAFSEFTGALGVLPETQQKAHWHDLFLRKHGNWLPHATRCK